MIGIFVVARLGSYQLKKKHLKQALGKSFIQWLIFRFYIAFIKEIQSKKVHLFITTSEGDSRNRFFEKIFSSYPDIRIFYGSDENIPLRQLQCAEKYGIDKIISVDGDDILCSTNAARKVIKALQNGGSFVITKGLPIGTNVMGYKTSILKQSLENNDTKKLETGWGRIFESIKPDIIFFDGESFELRMTLDYEEDALFFKKVIEGLGEKINKITDKKLIDYIIKNELNVINYNLNNKYWENFTTQKDKEINHEK